MQEMWSRADPLEEEMATHSSILPWKNPMDRGAWLATIYGVTKSRTWLSTRKHLIQCLTPISQWIILKGRRVKYKTGSQRMITRGIDQSYGGRRWFHSEEKHRNSLIAGTLSISAFPIMTAIYLKHCECLCCDRNTVVVVLSFQVISQQWQVSLRLLCTLNYWRKGWVKAYSFVICIGWGRGCSPSLE